jgi:hypothetical protein
VQTGLSSADGISLMPNDRKYTATQTFRTVIS